VSRPSPKLHQRARVAALTRRRDPDDPELAAARADLAEERIVEYIEKTVTGMAPLTPEARTRIALKLLSGPSEVSA
jgi:hypothetical protein